MLIELIRRINSKNLYKLKLKCQNLYKIWGFSYKIENNNELWCCNVRIASDDIKHVAQVQINTNSIIDINTWT